MAIVTRYFAAAAAGAGDGTNWANRAALFTAGAWSTAITGFAFNGSDSMLCLINGTIPVTVAKAAGLFANPPTVPNPIIFHGCDSSGVALAPPDPNWTSDQPAWSDSTLPNITTSGNIQTITFANTFFARLVKFTATGRSGAVLGGGIIGMDWCSVVNTTNSSSAQCVNNANKLTNCLFSLSGAAQSAAVAVENNCLVENCRLSAVNGASGNRNGIDYIGSTSIAYITGNTIVGFGGHGIAITSTSTSQRLNVTRNVIANNGGDGFRTNSTASQLLHSLVAQNMITGNGGYGINAQSAGHVIAANNRLRDNTSGNLNGLANYPTSFGNFTTDSSDVLEFVNAAGGDYRIRRSADIAESGFGVSVRAGAADSVTLNHGVFAK